MDEYCKERGFIAWFETSAKENINIEDAAKCLVTKVSCSKEQSPYLAASSFSCISWN